MTLRDTYDCVFGSGGLRSGYNLYENPYGFPLRDGYDVLLSGRGVGLRRPRSLRGRSGVAIPAGVTLPAASGGTPPYSYSVADLPDGASFAAATRTLSGTLTTAGDNVVTYRAQDSGTPATMAETTFDWSVLDVLATDHISLSDFDEGKVGYGISAFDFAYAVVLESGNDAGTTDVNLWRIQPNGEPIGSIHDDPFTTYGFNAAMTTLTRFWWRASRTPDRPTLYHNDTDVDGNSAPFVFSDWWADNSSRGLYLQRATGGPGVSLGGPSASGGGWASWNSITTAEQTWIRANLNNTNRFLLVIA